MTSRIEEARELLLAERLDRDGVVRVQQDRAQDVR